MKISRAIGIDLGTTNSVVGLTDRTETDIICYEGPNRQKLIPSVVAYDSRKEEIIVGRRAFNRRGTKPEPVVSIKRKMGTKETEALGDREMLPEEISSCILAECKQLMEEQLNANSDNDEYIIDRAVITYPAYFSLNAVEATRKAGELAGLEVVEVLQEPTAAAIYYSWKHDIENGNFMVYDLGGGTFDVAIVRKISDFPMVVGVSGNNFLGGDNFDRLLARDILQKLKESEGYSLELDLDDQDDLNRFTKLVLEAEGIKKALSTDENVYYQKQGVFTDHNGLNVNIEMEFFKEDFEKLIGELVASTIPECEKALEKAESNAGLAISDIDYILMVGGSTKIPLVCQTVKDKYCMPAEPHVQCEAPVIYEPDMAVGYGAAIRAASYPTKVFSDDESMCVSMETVGMSSAHEYKVKGTVEKRKGSNISLQGCKLEVSNPEGTLSFESPVNDDGSFELENISLTDDEITDFNFVLYDADGNVMIDFNEAIKPPSMETPNVLSKPIYIDLYNPKTQEIMKELLLEEGTPLPTEKEFVFYTNEHTKKHLKINLYENYTLLKSIENDFDEELPVGTPVKLTLYVSQTVVITAKGEVANHAFNAVIELPEPEVPSLEYYEARKKELDELMSYLKPGDQALIKAKKRNICIHIDEAYRDKENQKIIEYVDKLRELIQEAKDMLKEWQIEPSQEVFDALVNEVLELIDEVKRIDKPCNVSPENVKAQQTKAHEGYEQKNQQLVTECFNHLQATKQNLKSIIQEDDGVDKPPPWQIAAYLCMHHIPGELDKLSQMLREEQSGGGVVISVPSPDIFPETTSHDKANLDVADIEKLIVEMGEEAKSYIPTISPTMSDAEAYKIIQACQQILLKIDRIKNSL